MEALQQAIIESRAYKAIREREQEVIEAAREFLNVMLNGEPLPEAVRAQTRLEKALIFLDAVKEAVGEDKQQ